QFFIVSEFRLAGLKEEAPSEALTLDMASVVVVKAQGEKCERCWTISSKVDENDKHPTLCPRCADVVEKYYV
ncbi:MAG: zinc finger domain-containing protein, partial [Paenisporosarcina sp.]